MTVESLRTDLETLKHQTRALVSKLRQEASAERALSKAELKLKIAEAEAINNPEYAALSNEAKRSAWMRTTYAELYEQVSKHKMSLIHIKSELQIVRAWISFYTLSIQTETMLLENFYNDAPNIVLETVKE